MSFFLLILTFTITYLIPIIQTILQIWEFITNKKESSITVNGNIYETTINYEVQEVNSSRLSENIEYIRKKLFSFYPKMILLLFIFNFISNWTNLPSDSILKGNTNNFSLFTNGLTPIFEAIIQMFANAFIATILPTVSLTVSFLSVLLLKKILHFKFANLFTIAYYILTIFCYLQLYQNLKDFDLTSISIIINVLNVTIDYSPLVTLFAFITMFIFTAVSQTLINIIFETKETKKDFKLLENLLPRFRFYIFLVAIPIVLSFIINYYKN